MILFIEPVAIQLSAQQAELIDSGNSFAIDIFRNVAEAEQEGKKPDDLTPEYFSCTVDDS